MIRLWSGTLAALLFCSIFSHARAADDATISFSPSTGSFSVGSTVDVSLVINTGSQAINAVDVGITFPADKLQIISPSVGTSFISIWTAQPSYSNTNGTLSFSGGLPHPGIKSSAAILATIKFRVKSTGTAVLGFSDDTKVLANDSFGTNVLSSKVRAIFNLKNAPPEGPAVASSTHPDSNTWYSDRTANFSWETISAADGYSYIIDNAAKTNPDKTITGKDTSASLTAETDGVWFFHVRAVSGETWGGTSHFLFRIDSTAPAQFTPKLEREMISSDERSIVSFFTTDAASGIDHYEIKVIDNAGNNSAVTLFHEESSPYQLPPLPVGNYTITVRAFDVAGNYTDGTVSLTVATAGWAFFGNLGWPGYLAIGIGLLLLLLLVFRRRHQKEDVNPVLQPQLPANPGLQ